MKYFGLFCLSALLLGGCATVESSCAGGYHMVSIKNSGWKLFNLIPVASGNVNHPNRKSSLLFHDSTSLENNIKMLDEAVRNSGACGFRNLSSFIQEENVLFILLSRRVYHTSAELVFEKSLAE